MNVFIFTLGTRGDVQPYVALGRGLVAAGHRAVICTDSRFRPLIVEHGLEAADFNGLFTELTDSSAGREIMEDAGTAWQLLKNLPRLLRLSAKMQQALMDDGWRAAQAAAPDLIVYHPKAFGGPHFAERLHVPVAMAVPLPMLVPTGEFPVIGFPRLPLGAAYHRATYRVLHRLMRTISGQPIARWRRAQGLPPLARRQDWLHTRTGQPIPVLHAYSPLVGPCRRIGRKVRVRPVRGIWNSRRGGDRGRIWSRSSRPDRRRCMSASAACRATGPASGPTWWWPP